MSAKDDLPWLRGVCEKRGIPTIKKDTEVFLVKTLTDLKPARILEVGTAIGYSASVMAKLLPDAKITTIEKYDRSFYDAKEAFERLGLTEQIDQHLGDGSEVMEKLIGDDLEYDFIFIDAAKAHYMEFFEKALKLSHEGTLIVCDNVMLKEAASGEDPKKMKRFRTSIARMDKFLQSISDMDIVETKIYDIGDGVSVSHVR